MRKLLTLVVMLLIGATVWAQQPAPQPLTFWYEYTVRPGKEADFMNLVNTIGAPVRDKLMADGVVLAWGMETPLLRSPGGGTHLIWYAVNDWAGVEKVQRALGAQIAKVGADVAKANEEMRKKGQKPGPTLMEQQEAALDLSKTRDYLTRDLVTGGTQNLPPSGTLPLTRYNFAKVHPGKSGDYRAAWEKYNKPVFDKLVASGVVLAYGLAIEEVKTDGNFTHFAWMAVKDASGFDKIRDAFISDRTARSQEEREAIGALFGSLSDADAARSIVTFSTIFKVAGQK